MRVHPAIAALRSDQALQRRPQEAMSAALAAWHESSGVCEVKRELATYRGGQNLADLPSLKAILSNHVDSIEFVGQFFGIFQSALREEPLGEVPLRHGSSAGFSRLQLMRSGGALLSLCVYEPVDAPNRPKTVQFIDCSVEEIVVSGSARGTFHELHFDRDGGAQVTLSERQWQPGDRIALGHCKHARQMIDVDQTLLILQLTYSPPNARPSYEYRLSDSQLVQQSSGNKRSSEQVMALAVLGALQHQDAIGQMAVFAQDAAHDSDARWEAVRQTLALNTERGVSLLEALSTNAEDTLTAPARHLHEHLLASQLKNQSQMEEEL